MVVGAVESATRIDLCAWVAHDELVVDGVDWLCVAAEVFGEQPEGIAVEFLCADTSASENHELLEDKAYGPYLGRLFFCLLIGSHNRAIFSCLY